MAIPAANGGVIGGNQFFAMRITQPHGGKANTPTFGDLHDASSIGALPIAASSLCASFCQQPFLGAVSANSPVLGTQGTLGTAGSLGATAGTGGTIGSFCGCGGTFGTAGSAGGSTQLSGSPVSGATAGTAGTISLRMCMLPATNQGASIGTQATFCARSN